MALVWHQQLWRGTDDGDKEEEENQGYEKKEEKEKQVEKCE